MKYVSKQISAKVASLAVLFSFILLNSCKEKTKYGDYNNLEFRVDKQLTGWIVVPWESQQVEIDSNVNKDGKHPLVLMEPDVMDLTLPLRGSLQQRILLPETDADSVYIAITSKAENLKKARMVITGVDQQEDILYTDTLQMMGENEWQTFSKSFVAHNARFLHILIEADGADRSSDQRLYLDRMQVKLGNKDLSEFNLPDINNLQVLDQEDIVPLSLEDHSLYDDIDLLKSKKVIGIGESIHGSRTMNRLALELVKHQIENNNTNLVLIELPLEKMLSFNRFVAGDERFKLDSLLSDPSMLYSREELESLLIWLKRHNAGTEQKQQVSLLGMDMHFVSKLSAMSLFDYVFALNSTIKSPVLDSICRALFKSEPYSLVLELLDKNPSVQEHFDEREYQVFVHSLKMSAEAGSSSNGRYRARDSYMFKNSTFLIDLLSPADKKTVIYGHFGHVNYKSTDNDTFITSLGQQMKEIFGESYSTIGILTEKGSIATMTGDSSKVGVSKIGLAPNTSLESWLSKTDGDYFYVPPTSLPDQAVTIRAIGNADLPVKRQFRFVMPKSRMDAAIFIRESEPMKFTADVMTGVQYAIFKMTNNWERLKAKTGTW